VVTKNSRKTDETDKDRGVQPISMPGFGKGAVEHEAVSVEVELKTVNTRFLDFNFKLPRLYSQFEMVLREQISSRLSRGRVEIYVLRTPKKEEACAVGFNRALFDSFYKECTALADELECFDEQMRSGLVRDLLSKRDILDLAEEAGDIGVEKDLVQQAVGKALEELCAMRKEEGARLGIDLVERLDQLEKIRTSLEELTAGTPEELKSRLLERISKLAPEVTLDEARMATEVAYIVDRADVTEELVRLESHLSQFQASLGESPNGRKLEFLLQELGREFNTIGSKAQDSAIQTMVVEAKSHMEKMREQVLNLE